MWSFSETVFAADGHGLISGGHKQMAIWAAKEGDLTKATVEVVRVKCGSRGARARKWGQSQETPRFIDGSSQLRKKPGLRLLFCGADVPTKAAGSWVCTFRTTPWVPSRDRTGLMPVA